MPLNNSVYNCMLPPYGSSNCPSEVTDANGEKNLLFPQINGGLREMFYHQNISTYPSNTAVENIKNYIFASNRGITYHIFNNTFHSAELYSYGLTPETLFPCVFHLLFKPKQDICDSACLATENRMRVIGNNASNVLIGVHVRDETSSDAPEHFFCADRLIQHYKNINKVTTSSFISPAAMHSSTHLFNRKFTSCWSPQACH